MDLAKVIQQLREELKHLDAAILSLEKVQESGHRRGRAPEWMADVDPQKAAKPKPKPGRKKPGDESQ